MNILTKNICIDMFSFMLDESLRWNCLTVLQILLFEEAI
jgi:hypothetical protein